MKVIAIDLGKRVSGYALFDDQELFEAGEVKSPRGLPHVMAGKLHLIGIRSAWLPTTWVVERMMDYRGKGARRTALQNLRDISDELESTIPNGHTFRSYRAAQWKGSTPKAVSHRRILAALTEAERRCIRPQTKESLDAVGIGMFHVERLGRGMVRL